jgi:biopolymer transport protein ExbD
MAKRWDHGDDLEISDEELNLIPYLDIMVNLVIFLLFSFQVIIEMSRIDILAPAYEGPSSGPSKAVDTTVTIVASKEGYTVLSSEPATTGVIDIKRLPSGKHDTEQLHSKLVEWKKNFQLSEGVVLTADGDMDYDVIVQTMDAVRQDGDRDLFPNVMLARAAGQAVKQ